MMPAQQRVMSAASSQRFPAGPRHQHRFQLRFKSDLHIPSHLSQMNMGRLSGTRFAILPNSDFFVRVSITDMIATGVFGRFPRLQVGAVEQQLGWATLTNRIAVDALGMPYNSSRLPTGSRGCGNLVDLGNPGLTKGVSDGTATDSNLREHPQGGQALHVFHSAGAGIGRLPRSREHAGEPGATPRDDHNATGARGELGNLHPSPLGEPVARHHQTLRGNP